MLKILNAVLACDICCKLAVDIPKAKVQNWWGGGPLSGATMTLYFSDHRPILPPAYVKRSLPIIWLFCTDFVKALWLTPVA